MTFVIDQVVSRTANEEAWLAARRGLLTASDAASILQVGFFAKSWQELAQEKRKPTFEASEHTEAGKIWEDPIRKYAQGVLGFRLEGNDSLAVGRTDCGVPLGATVDGWVLGNVTQNSLLTPWLTVVRDGEVSTGGEALLNLRVWRDSRERVGLEIKNQRSKSRSKWNKPLPPPQYAAQTLHQRIVGNDDGSILCAKVDANELYVHLIDHDIFEEEEYLELCRDFYERHPL